MDQERKQKMADNRKEQERAELHRTIWSIANDLRGSVDGGTSMFLFRVVCFFYLCEVK
jgi:type I restriction enzyme M protein